MFIRQLTLYESYLTKTMEMTVIIHQPHCHATLLLLSSLVMAATLISVMRSWRVYPGFVVRRASHRICCRGRGLAHVVFPPRQFVHFQSRIFDQFVEGHATDAQ